MRRLWLLLLAGCQAAPAGPPAVRDCRLHVRAEAEAVVFADGRAAVPLAHGAADVALPPGRTLYLLEAGGRRVLDEANPLSTRLDGEEWSAFYAEDCARPAFAATPPAVGPRSLAATLVFERTRAGDDLDAASVRATVDDRPLAVEADADAVRVAVAGLPPGKHHLRVEARDTAGRDAEPFEAPFWSEPADVSEAFRWDDALIYQVIVDRFAADAPFTPEQRLQSPGRRFGGHLRGLLRVLQSGYFERLGVNALWISPLNRNPEGLFPGVEGGPARYEGYHGYWPVSPRDVDPHLGTPEDVDALVAEAHRRGIRVLMDVVLNHVHQYHPYVTQHPDWFDPRCTCGTAACPWSSHIETCWFTGYLPDVAFDRPESLEAQVDDAMGWVRRFDLDGLRVDAVPMMPRFVTRLLTARAHRLEGLRTRQYLLGETYTGPEGHDLIRWYLGPQGLDGQFDFPLMWALRAVFAHESAPLWTLDDVFAASREAWAGSTAVMGLMVGNHDVTRFLSEAAGQYTGDPWNEPPPVPDDPVPYRRLLLAQAFVLTAPGAPILYYGDELGMPGAGDPDNRRPMRFDAERSANERALQAQIERLGRLRRCLPALRRGGFEPLRVTRDQYAYLRDVGDGAPALVVLNRAAQPADVRVALPRGLGPLVDALSGAPAVPAADGELRVRVGARSPAVLIPAANPCLEGAPR